MQSRYECDQVVRPVRQRGVVERPLRLGYAHRFRAHLDDQRLADRATPPGRGACRDALRFCSPAAFATSSVRPVNVITGCRARGSTPCSAAGASTVDAVRARRVHDDLARPGSLPAAVEAADQTGEHVIGHGEQHEVGQCGDLVGRQEAARRAAARRRAAPKRATPLRYPRRGARPRPTPRRRPRRRALPTRRRWPGGRVASSPVWPTLRRLAGRERLARARRHVGRRGPPARTAVVAEGDGERFRMADGPPPCPDDLGDGLVVPLPAHRPDRTFRDAVPQERQIGDGLLVAG